jgi:hypothetical protein
LFPDLLADCRFEHCAAWPAGRAHQQGQPENNFSMRLLIADFADSGILCVVLDY